MVREMGGSGTLPDMDAPATETTDEQLDACVIGGGPAGLAAAREIARAVPGARVTVYEIAPGDTVTLTESVPLALSSVVVTGAGTATRMAAPQAVGKAAAPRRDEARPMSTPDSQPAPTTVSGAVVASPVPSARVGTLNGLKSISWIDPVTGATLTLSGRVSEARLQQTRFRIERERAAAAKKTP